MTCYRCVCSICTAYISSAEEPLHGVVDAWREEWEEECEEFLSLPCSEHVGHPYEDAREHEYHTGREEYFARLYYGERCVCPTCTAYTCSLPEPDRESAEWAHWQEQWERERVAFLALDCDEHASRGYPREELEARGRWYK